MLYIFEIVEKMLGLIFLDLLKKAFLIKNVLKKQYMI